MNRSTFIRRVEDVIFTIYSIKVCNLPKGWFNYFWYQHLNQLGYIVACVDNRGTGGKGAEFKKMTYQELGRRNKRDN